MYARTCPYPRLLRISLRRESKTRRSSGVQTACPDRHAAPDQIDLRAADRFATHSNRTALARWTTPQSHTFDALDPVAFGCAARPEHSSVPFRFPSEPISTSSSVQTAGRLRVAMLDGSTCPSIVGGWPTRPRRRRPSLRSAGKHACESTCGMRVECVGCSARGFIEASASRNCRVGMSKARQTFRSVQDGSIWSDCGSVRPNATGTRENPASKIFLTAPR